MLTGRFLMNREVHLEPAEHVMLENAVSLVKTVASRSVLVHAGQDLSHSTLLVEGLLCRYMDDRKGMRQLVAIHVPGDFVDLHGYPLKVLDHDVAALTTAKVALVPHNRLDRIMDDAPQFARKLWYATLLDAAMHRAWLFRLGRLDATARVAHFLSETNTRLAVVGLSDGRRFDFDITQTDLAESCGLTSVHVNRVLRTLREDGLCTFRSGVVEIFDPIGLARRGEFNPDYLYLQAAEKV